MTTIDAARVAEARRRLRERSANGAFVDDDALRIVRLDSPRVGELPLELHRSLAIVANLGDGPRQSLAATIDAIRQRNPNLGLTGTIEIRGRERQLDSLERPLRRPGAGLLEPQPLLATAESQLFVEVAEAVERAVLLANAELRGADLAAAELALKLEATTSQLIAASPRGEDAASMLATIDQVRLSDSTIDQLRSLLVELDTDRQRTAYTAAVEQAYAAKSRVLPGDGNQAMLLADLAIAEADGSLAAYDMAPDGVAERLHEVLESVGLGTHPADAPNIALRALTENEHLDRMRADILATTPALEAGQNPGSEATDSVHHELRLIDDLRMRIQRRLRSQQQLLALARQTVHELRTGVELASSSNDDLTPLLIEDPLADVPGSLGGAVLSLLLRHSVHRQIICVSEVSALDRWTQSVSGRAGWVHAHGWFSAR